MIMICKRRSSSSTCRCLPNRRDNLLIFIMQVEDGTRAERGEVSSPALRALWAWVDGSLLASSHDRKYLAFQLFTLLLPSLR